MSMSAPRASGTLLGAHSPDSSVVLIAPDFSTSERASTNLALPTPPTQTALRLPRLSLVDPVISGIFESSVNVARSDDDSPAAHAGTSSAGSQSPDVSRARFMATVICALVCSTFRSREQQSQTHGRGVQSRRAVYAPAVVCVYARRRWYVHTRHHTLQHSPQSNAHAEHIPADPPLFAEMSVSGVRKKRSRGWLCTIHTLPYNQLLICTSSLF